MQRTVQPEILDSLPSCNIDAIASRRDLLKINFLMGNYRWIQSKIRSQAAPQPKRYLEIGAGDGALARRLMEGLPSGAYDALDFSSQPRAWPEESKWISADLLQFGEYESYHTLIANLILHHFEADDLEKLGKGIRASGIRRIIACEPCRRSFHKWQLRSGKLIGFNYVTLHDGCVSVDAGFRGDELPQLLGLSKSDWTWQTKETLMGAYRMVAERK